jgi:predicted AlkP superfamily phosphohydrolase/phosphomutase
MHNITPGTSSETAATANPPLGHDTAIAVPTTTKQAASQNAAQEAATERAREVGASLATDELSIGDGDSARRLLLLCLDGLMPELALGLWRGELPTLAKLARHGIWGHVSGSLPAGALPASLCLLSGTDPGQLGVYGPHRRTNHTYATPVPVDSHAIHTPRLWDILGTAGRRVGVVGAPATTPAPAVRGHLIGDKLLEEDRRAAYPPELNQQIAAWIEDALLEPPLPADDPLSQLIRNTYLHTEQRFLLARRLLAREVYDCFVLADDGIATMQRALWNSLDPAHPHYIPDHPFEGAIGSFYRFIDDQIAELLALVDEDTIVAVVSAHGAQSLHGELALNQWLIEQGELVLRTPPAGAASLEECDVDWTRTRAWAGDNGTVYLNIAGREPEGIIPREQAVSAAAQLAQRLRTIAGPDDQGAIRVYRPSALYAAVNGIAPDLLVSCALPGWRLTARLGEGGTWVNAGDAGVDTGYDTPEGFLTLYDPHHLGGGRQIDEMTIYDILPTLLDALNQPSPRRLRGQVIPRV